MILDLRKAADRIRRPLSNYENEWRPVPGFAYEWSSLHRLRMKDGSKPIEPGHSGTYRLYRRGEVRIVTPAELDILCRFKENHYAE